MLDLETLSTRPEATILTFGACKFSPYNQEPIDKGIYFRVSVDEQITLGRHIDDNTVEWWGRQADDVREEALGESDRITLSEFTAQLNKFLVGCDNIWAQGPVFDIAILENLYAQLSKPTPWQFWQIRDSRTLFQVHGDPRDKERAGAHNALIDCYYQAEGVQAIYKQIGVKKKEWSK